MLWISHLHHTGGTAPYSGQPVRKSPFQGKNRSTAEFCKRLIREKETATEFPIKTEEMTSEEGNATVKRIVCLANSRKLNGRCIAGREWNTDQASGWIRPISHRTNQEISEYERQYEDGSDPRVLDIIDIPLMKPQPQNFQTENWLIDPEYYWERVGKVSLLDMPKLTGPETRLWLNGYSTYNGLNDKIPLEVANSCQHSLTMVHVEDLKLSVFSPGEAFGNKKRRVQGHFSYDQVEYRLWVTDPLFEKRYLAKPNGNHDIGDCFLTVSLGEPFDGAVYKLIASIIGKQRGSSL